MIAGRSTPDLPTIVRSTKASGSGKKQWTESVTGEAKMMNGAPSPISGQSSDPLAMKMTSKDYSVLIAWKLGH